MTKERAGSLIFLIAGTYGLIFSFSFPTGSLTEPGPWIFPFSISVLLLISGTSMFIRGKGKETVDRNGLMKRLVTPIQIVGLTVVLILILERLGYLVAISLYLFVILLWVCRYKFWVALIFAIALGTGSWYLFEKLLVIRLPAGILSL